MDICIKLKNGKTYTHPAVTNIAIEKNDQIEISTVYGYIDYEDFESFRVYNPKKEVNNENEYKNNA